MAKLLTGTRIYGTGTVDTQLFVNGTLASTSTTTGALGVVGGAGIGGNLYVGGISVLPGVQATNIVASGTLGVTATSTLGVLNATSATFSGTLGVTGTSVLGLLNATSATFSGTLGVTGTSVFAGLTTVNNTTSATSTTTGALVVSGGVGIGKDLRVGGIIYGTFNGSVTGTATTATNIAGGLAGQIPYQTGPGVTSFLSTGTAGNVLVSNGSSAPTYNNTLTLTGTTAASSTNTGALQVVGGVGVGGNTWIGGSALVSGGNIDLRNSTTSSIVMASLAQQGNTTVFEFGRTDIANTPAIDFHSSGANIDYDVRIQAVGGSTSTIGQGRLDLLANQVYLNSTQAAISTQTGALRVDGGVGIGRSLFVQESMVQVGGTYSTLAATYNLINTTATTVNFAGSATSLTIGAPTGSTTVRNNLSVTGNLTVQGTTTIVDSTVTNIADPIITLGGGANNAAPTVDDNKDRGIAFKWVNNGGTTSTGFFGYDDSTGYLTYIQTATITNEVVSGTKGAIDAHLAGGTAMSIHYQSAADTTAFLPAGTSGYILQTNGIGSAPSWVNASGVSAGSATNADAIRTLSTTTNATYYPAFVDSNNASNAYESLYTTSSFSINPQSGTVTLGGTLYISNLRADATTSATTWGVFYNTVTKELTTATAGSTTSASGTGTTSTFVINNSTAATSTNTGALQVVNGGAGIGGNIYAGGDIYSRGTKVIPLSIQEFTATAGQTTFTISGGYTVGTVQVFANGINLGSADIVASNGTTVTLLEPRAVGDIVRVISGGTSSAMNNAQNFSIAMSIAMSM